MQFERHNYERNGKNLINTTQNTVKILDSFAANLIHTNDVPSTSGNNGVVAQPIVAQTTNVQIQSSNPALILKTKQSKKINIRDLFENSSSQQVEPVDSNGTFLGTNPLPPAGYLVPSKNKKLGYASTDFQGKTPSIFAVPSSTVLPNVQFTKIDLTTTANKQTLNHNFNDASTSKQVNAVTKSPIQTPDQATMELMRELGCDIGNAPTNNHQVTIVGGESDSVTYQQTSLNNADQNDTQRNSSVNNTS